MKITYHIPIEPYGFIEVEVEAKGHEKPDSYKDIKDLFRSKDAGEDI